MYRAFVIPASWLNSTQAQMNAFIAQMDFRALAPDRYTAEGDDQ
jgi:hypothetical protein